MRHLIARLGALVLCCSSAVFAQSPTQPVFGFADLHAHVASHLAFGADDSGNNGIFWGKPGLDVTTANTLFDMPACLRILPVSEQPLPGVDFPGAPPTNSILLPVYHGAPTDYVQYVTQQTIMNTLDTAQNIAGAHTGSGAATFTSWPDALLLEHQQMHITAIKRAFDGGLRLMFATTHDDEPLSDLWSQVHISLNNGRVPQPVAGFDLASAKKQIDFIKSLATANSSWMQIVKTPAEARQAINANKLAIVLSVEMDALSLPQILDLVNNHDVRHVIAIHLVNNSFGGSAINNDLFNADTYFQNQSFFQVDFDPSISFRLGEPVVLTSGPFGSVQANPCQTVDSCPDPLPSYNAQPGGHKNQMGLTDKQGFLALMQAGVMLDVAHMSEKATEDALTLAEDIGYPLMDSHTQIRATRDSTRTERNLLPLHALRIGNLGGVVGFGSPWDGSVADPVSQYLTDFDAALTTMGGRGVGLGTDFNDFQTLIPGSGSGVHPPVPGSVQADIGYPVQIGKIMAGAVGLSAQKLPAYATGNAHLRLETERAGTLRHDSGFRSSTSR